MHMVVVLQEVTEDGVRVVSEQKGPGSGEGNTLEGADRL